MNIQNRYDSCLSDVLTLLQQAVYRFIADLQVDLTKFFQYFKQFHRNLLSLENNFHPNKIKFSKYLSKIHQLTQQIDFKIKQKTISLQPQQNTFYKTLNNKKSLKAQTSSKKSNTIQKTQQLNVIGQIEQREDFDDIKLKFKKDRLKQGENFQRKRVGTAQGVRQKMSVTIDFQNERPYTGSNRREKIVKSSQKLLDQAIKDRYKSLTKYEKTIINSQINNDFSQQLIDQQQQPRAQKKIFKISNRRSIYDVLQQQKKLHNKDNRYDDDQFLKLGLVKLPQKKKTKNYSRWSFKINKLL